MRMGGCKRYRLAERLLLSGESVYVREGVGVRRVDGPKLVDFS